jgi:membrane-bound metal-dependent hydrolase YbcI (DUF457 family)
MIVVNHGLSGYLCGQVAMPLLRRRAPLPERSLGWAFFLGAMLPDFDIVAKLFGRAVYFSGAWYAHRHASHSLLGTLALALLATALLQRWLVPAGGQRPWAARAWLAGCCWAGGWLHIFGDLFTPGWQMPLFWPLAVKFGAWSHIGWFSPYLLWLFVSTIAILWLLRALAGRWANGAAWPGMAAWGIATLATLRWVSFLVTARYESWSQWHAYHRTLLPEAMISPVASTVSVIWRWLTG